MEKKSGRKTSEKSEKSEKKSKEIGKIYPVMSCLLPTICDMKESSRKVSAKHKKTVFRHELSANRETENTCAQIGKSEEKNQKKSEE